MGGQYWDSGLHLDVDRKGNVISIGAFEGTANFQTGTTPVTLTSVGLGDGYVVKHDNSGNLLWTKRIGGNSEDLNGVAADTMGNIYVCGMTYGGTDLDPGPATYTLPSNGQREIFLVKLDPFGNFLWAFQLGSVGEDFAFGVTVDHYNDVVITGLYNDTIDFDPGSGTFTMASVPAPFPLNQYDGFVAKYTHAGNFVWARGLNGSGDVWPTDIASDTLGNTYSVGYVYGTTDFDPGAGTYTIGSGNAPTGYIVKLDAAGNFSWAAGFVGNSVNVQAISVDDSCNIYTTGNFNFYADFDPSAGTYTLGGNGDHIFISKLRPNGSFVWARHFQSNTNSVGGYGIANDSIGNVYVSGGFHDTVDFDPGPGTYTLQALNPTNNQSDGFIAKLTMAGNLAWVRRIGGPSWDAAFKMREHKGDLFLTGSFHVGADFDQAPASYSLSTYGSYDAFVMKLSSCSTPANATIVTPSQSLLVCSGNAATVSATSQTGNLMWYAGITSTAVIGTGTTFVTPPLSAGTFTYYASVQSCTQSAARVPVTITVTATPSITVSSGTICAGEIFTLSTAGAVSYSFQGGSSTVSPVSTSVYTVTGTSANNCVSAAVTATVNVFPLPVLSFLSSSPPICPGEAATISVSGAASYSWESMSVNAATIIVSPSITTSYTVTGTSAAGCIAQAVTTVEVSDCTGLAEVRYENDILIFPVPGSGEIILQLAANVNAGKVKVYSSSMQLLSEQSLSSTRTELNTRHLPSGQYFVEIVLPERKTVMRKIVIAR